MVINEGPLLAPSKQGGPLSYHSHSASPPHTVGCSTGRRANTEVFKGGGGAGVFVASSLFPDRRVAARARTRARVGWTSGTDLSAGYRAGGGHRAEGILSRVPWRFQRHPQLFELPAARGGTRVGPLT